MSNERIALYGLLISAVILFGLGLYSQTDIAEGFFVQACGTLFTVFVVERLIGLDTDRKLRPAKLAAYKDAVTILGSASRLAFEAARSTVPDSELQRVQVETGKSADWLNEYLGRLTHNKFSPYLAEFKPPIITYMKWQQALPLQISEIQKLICRYLERHPGTADPAVTAAVHDLEENGLFRSTSYGPIFWNLDAEAQGSMWRDYMQKVDNLSIALDAVASKYPESQGTQYFEWKRLAIEIETGVNNPTRAPYRP